MKKLTKILVPFLTLLLLGTGISLSAAPGKNSAVGVDSFPKEALSQAEIDGLMLMREEEKLARDVYAALYQKWNLRVFNNIAASEQQHTGRVKDLLDKYGLSDPMTSMSPGQFANQELQNLYNTLVRKGSVSITEALRIGATIEDLDIKDLNELLKKTDNQDIQFVYQNLKRGSMNHMRAFYRQLGRYGVDYKAVYISQSELDQILASAQSRGGGRR